MLTDLVEVLRCLTPHEESWLVAVSRRTVGRSIVEGTLGCPVCRRQYPIVGGVAYFGVEPGGRSEHEGTAGDGEHAADGEEAMRLAAFLDLTTPGGRVLLAGAWARLAPALSELSGAHCILLNPTGSPTTRLDREGVTVVRSGGAVPLATGAVRGAALDSHASVDETIRGAVNALAPRGRLVAPVSALLPPGIEELARDAAHWVAARAAVATASAPIPLGRAPRRPTMP